MNSQQITLKQKILGPWKEFLSAGDLNQVEECSIAREFQRKHTSHSKDKIKVSFLGDMTDFIFDDYELDKGLLKSLRKSDVIVINLESIPFSQKGVSFNKNFVSEFFLKLFIEMFQTQQVIFGLANNHAYDFGEKGLKHTTDIIEKMGAHFIGTAEKGSIYLKPSLRLDAQTLWHSSKKYMTPRLSNKQIFENPQNDQVIKFLHWGEEFEEMPTDEQFSLVEEMEQTLLVCGHHGHCPQPIQYVNNILCAFSLGDFISQHKTNAPERGIHLQVEFSLEEGKWEIWRSHWEFLGQSGHVVGVVR